MIYPRDVLSDSDRDRLRAHVSTLDGPVYALTNLPETVMAALFARYSRYPGTLRRLLLDEFSESIADTGNSHATEGRQTQEFMDRVFLGFGDDSVSQLGGVHLACEWSSNLLTKILQRPRIASYLEQSTRYIAYDKPVAPAGDHYNGSWAGQYRYWRDDELGPHYTHAMDDLFATYASLLSQMRVWLAGQFPAPAGGGPRAAHERALNAKALDIVRGLLPAASLSHMGIYASAQAYEQLVMHLLAHPLGEARSYGQLMLSELCKVIPSFMTRVQRPDRGGRWIEYLAARRDAGDRWGRHLAAGTDGGHEGPSVRLLACDGTFADVLAALVFEHTGQPESETLDAIAQLSDAQRADMLCELIGDRENRRHRPGRGLERARYRFEIISDYGAFRDLQRHRMLTCQWQALSPDLGADVPLEIDAAGLGDEYRRALDVSAVEYERLHNAHGEHVAQMALCLAYRLRYILDLNAREAMHLIELRSGNQGHPAYRAVALEMHRQIAEVHPQLADAMSFVDATTDPRLERLQSEIRQQARLDDLGA